MDHPDGAIVLDALTMCITGEASQKFEVAYHDSRSITRGRTVDKLRKLCAWGKDRAKEMFDARIQQLHEELSRAASFDTGIRNLPETFPFDPERYYSSFGLAVPTPGTAGIQTVYVPADLTPEINAD